MALPFETKEAALMISEYPLGLECPFLEEPHMPTAEYLCGPVL